MRRTGCGRRKKGVENTRRGPWGKTGQGPRRINRCRKTGVLSVGSRRGFRERQSAGHFELRGKGI